MYANLMRAPGREHAFQQRRAPERLQHAPVRARLAPAGHDGHFLPVGRMPSDGRVHVALVGLHVPDDDGAVRALDGMRGNLLR